LRDQRSGPPVLAQRRRRPRQRGRSPHCSRGRGGRGAVRARSIVITGATSGIGRALAIAYAQPEARLCLLGRGAGRMAQVGQACEAGGAQVETALVDVRDRDALIGCIAAWDEQRPLDLAIASAGIAGGLGPGRDLESSEAVQAILAVDLGGV